MGRDEETYINDTVVPIILWHLIRFVSPTKLFKNQQFRDKDLPDCDGITFEHTKEGFIQAIPENMNQIFEAEVLLQDVLDVLHQNTDSSVTESFPSVMREYRVRNVNEVFVRNVADGAIEPEIGKILSNDSFIGKFMANGNRSSVQYVVEFRTIYKN
jgi:hypothetical protein